MSHMMSMGGYPPPPSYGPGVQFSGQYAYASRLVFLEKCSSYKVLLSIICFCCAGAMADLV